MEKEPDTFANGVKYEGEWKYDKRDGQGTLIMPDLDAYVGGWKEGKRSGQGTFTLEGGEKNTKVNGQTACVADRELILLLTVIYTLVNGKILLLPVVGTTGLEDKKHGLTWTQIGSGFITNQNHR